MRSLRLSRRRILRGLGLGGIAVALPPLEAMFDDVGRSWGIRRAYAQTARQFVVFHWPQGVPTGWLPEDGAWFPTRGGRAWTTTPCLVPLEPHRADFNVLSGLNYRPIWRALGAHGHAVAAFTGRQPGGTADRELSSGPSVEIAAGKRIGLHTRFPNITTGLYSQGEGYWSWSAAGVKNQLELDPRALWTRLFSAASDPAAAARAATRSQSVLDFVAADITELQASLGAEDQVRLDQHLTSIRELERAVTTPPSAACSPAPIAQPQAFGYSDGDATAYYRVMIDLVVTAMRCDLTRSAMITGGPSQNTRRFPHLGISQDYHLVCHEDAARLAAGLGPALARSTAYQYYVKIATWHMEQVAYLMARLKEDTGLGQLLDTCAMVATSEFGDGGIHHERYVPFIVAGKAGRTGTEAMPTGNNLIFPCNYDPQVQQPTDASWCRDLPGRANRCTNDVWQSALEAVGALVPGEVFGDPTLDTRPLEGLWV